MEDSGYGGGTHSVEGALLFKRIAITFDEMGATREGLREAQPLYLPASRVARRARPPRGLCDEVSAADGADDSPCGCAALAALLLFSLRAAVAFVVAVPAVIHGVKVMHRPSCRPEASWLILLALTLGAELLVELCFFLLALAIRTHAACCARSLAPASLVYAWGQLVELIGNVYVLHVGVKIFILALQEKLADSTAHPEQGCTKGTLMYGACLCGIATLAFAISVALKIAFAVSAAYSPRKAWLFAAVGAAPFRAIAGEWSDDSGGAFAPLRAQEMTRRVRSEYA